MTYVIDNGDGSKIPCMWEDCARPGHEEHKAIVTEPTRRVHFVFCTRRHLLYWVNSHRNHHNLPSGSKGILW